MTHHNRWLTVLVVLLMGASIWGFFELADVVADGEVDRFDRLVLLAMRNPADLNDPVGPRWLEEVMRDFTALGGIAVSTLLTISVSLTLLLKGNRSMATVLLSAVLGGVLLSTLLKSSYDRPRPDLAPHGSIVYTKSFPSGHATTAATVYLTLGVLLGRIQTLRAMRYFLLFLGVALTVAVGVSRVYLAVHWPTDVVAGWALGSAWAAASWLGVSGLTQLLHARGTSVAAQAASDLSEK